MPQKALGLLFQHVEVYGIEKVLRVKLQVPEVHGLFRHIDGMKASSGRVLIVVSLDPYI